MQTGLETPRQGAPIGPSFTVRHWSVTQAAASLSSAESEVKAITKGCIETKYVKNLLEHQTARPFKIELWTDSSSAKAIMQRLGPEQTGYAGERGRLADKTRSKSSIRQAVRNMMGFTLPDEETHKFQEYTNINQNYWDQKLAAAIERLPVFDDGENESLEDDVHRFVDKKRLISRQPF